MLSLVFLVVKRILVVGFLVLLAGVAAIYLDIRHVTPAMACSAMKDIAASPTRAAQITTVLESFFNTPDIANQLKTQTRHRLYNVIGRGELAPLDDIELKWNQRIGYAVTLPDGNTGKNPRRPGRVGVWINRGYVAFEASYSRNGTLVLDRSSATIDCDAATKLLGPRP